MHARLWKFVIFVGCVAAIGGVTFRQWQANNRLRADAARLRSPTAEIEMLQAAHQRLTAQQTSPEELVALNAAATEVARLRTEAAAIRGQAEARRVADENLSPAVESPPVAEAWTNAGRATPLAAFQTGVWAVVQSDTDALAGLTTFDAAGRALVDALFARLPPESRTLHGSAENVFATLLAARLPQNLSSVDVVRSTTSGAADEMLRMRMTRNDGSAKEANFNFTRDAEGWRIVVPTTVVENYIAMLKGGLPQRPNPSTLRTGAVTVGSR